MFRKEEMESLPADARKEMLKLAEKLKRGEITQEEYEEICSEIIENAEDRAERPEAKRGRPSLRDDQNPEYISDIIKYAGVNLKEEALKIAKEADTLPYEDSRQEETDQRNTIGFLFDVNAYVHFLNRVCKLYDISISEEAAQAVFQATQRKLMDLLEKMIEHSKTKADLARSEYLIRIENDRKKQMWYLEQEEKLEMDKYRQKKETDEGDGKKKWRKMLQEREDLIIKKRLSNNVALAALGSQPKSWMTATPSEEGSPYLSLLQNTEDRGQKPAQRVITKSDFISVLARDKRYNKTTFAIKHCYL